MNEELEQDSGVEYEISFESLFTFVRALHQSNLEEEFLRFANDRGLNISARSDVVSEAKDFLRKQEAHNFGSGRAVFLCATSPKKPGRPRPPRPNPTPKPKK